MSSESAAPETKRYVGQVKWFNNKAGYGFITMTNEENKESDIFTHYSTVQVGDSQYKYLVQGEYVEFELIDSTNDKHQYQASNVTGIKGGKLMCETRQHNRMSSTENGRPSRPIRRSGPPGRRARRSGSDLSTEKNGAQESNDGFVKVQKKRTK
jgi:cold shock CspA family protein